MCACACVADCFYYFNEYVLCVRDRERERERERDREREREREEPDEKCKTFFKVLCIEIHLEQVFDRKIFWHELIRACFRARRWTPVKCTRNQGLAGFL